MKKKQSLPLLLALNLAVCMSTFANNPADNPHIAITGSIPTFVPNNTAMSAGQRLTATPETGHYVMLQRIKLSASAYKMLADNLSKTAARDLNITASDAGLASHIDLGMNDVPVLDQGAHGTCVTFSVTGSLDAVLGHADYISQLCNLSLGSYLHQQDPHYTSGWDGAWNDTVLGQIRQYGIISMKYQQQYGCGSAGKLKTSYPISDAKDTGSPMPTSDFTLHSEKIMPPITWKILLDKYDALTPKADMNKVFTSVKQALANGHRVVFGVLVDENGDLRFVNGAAGSYKTAHDSWIVTKQIEADSKIRGKIDAGHSIIITGYDDNAAITGPEGEKHKGVFTLRNSWGVSAGNEGDYYMSYDYFKKLTLEAEEIISASKRWRRGDVLIHSSDIT